MNEGYQPEDFKRVIEIKTEEWRNDPVWGKYLRPETLFGTKFESYLNHNVRKVVRILKMFCKSNPGWLMPGGLIQSILVVEQIQNYNRFDEMFYETVKAIKNRLDGYQDIRNPVTNQSILYSAKDRQRVKNLCNRLGNALNKLDILFKDTCTEEQAMNAWNEFFNHPFWSVHLRNQQFLTQ